GGGHRLPKPMQIVDTNVADVRSRHAHVGEDQRHFSQLQIFEQHFFHAESHHGHAFHSALNHAAYSCLYTLGVVAGGSQQNFVTVLYRNSLKNLYDLGEKRIGDFRNDQSEDPASP